MEVPKEIGLALDLAREMATKEGEVAIFANRIIVLLDHAVTMLDQVGEHDATLQLSSGGAAVYAVELGRNKEKMLTERRHGGQSKPHRCSRSLYEAVVNVFAASDKPLSVQDIVDGIEKATGDRSEEFRVRVPLRLWLDVVPPLIRKHRARYRCDDSNNFKAHALEVWTDLSRSP